MVERIKDTKEVFRISETDIKKFEEFLKKWCSNNPYEIYLDRSDRCPSHWAERFLAAKTQEQLYEAQDACYENMFEWYFDYSFEIQESQFKEAVQELEAEFNFEFEGTDEDREIKGRLFEYFRGFHVIEYGEAVKDYLRYCDAKVVATIRVKAGEDSQGEPYYVAPSSDYEPEYLEDLKALYEKDLGIKPEQFERFAEETMYPWTYLKICGQIDFTQFMEDDAKPLSEIRITPACTGNSLWHNSVNGSGNCWEPDLGCDDWFKADFRIDDPRMGIDAVYGMTGSFWMEYLEVR